MAIIFNDTFTVAVATDLAAHTPDTGTSWTQLQVTGSRFFQIVADLDALRASGNSGDSGFIYTADATYSTADYEVQVTFVTTFSTITPLYLMARIQDVENMYAVRIVSGASGMQLYKKVSGTWSTLGSAVTVADGSVIKLSVNGTAIKVYDDGAEVISVTDSSISGAGKAGLGHGGGVELVTSTDDTRAVVMADNFSVNTLSSTPTLAPDDGHVTSQVDAITMPTAEQSAYRFRRDDGDENDASWLAAENTPAEFKRGENFRLRMQVNSTGDYPSAPYQVEYRKKITTLLADTFTDNSFNTALWEKAYHIAITNPSVTVLETGGVLEVTPLSSTTGAHGNGALSLGTFSFEDCNCVIKVVSNVAAGTVWNNHLWVFVDNLNGFGFGYESGDLYFETYVAGTPDNTGITFNGTDHQWVRLRHDPSDDTLKWDTSPDGSTWTNRRSVSNPFDLSVVRIQPLSAGTYNSVASPGSAKATDFSFQTNQGAWVKINA
jgi:hypothetical protein